MENRAYGRKYPVVVFVAKLFNVFPIQYGNIYSKYLIWAAAVCQIILLTTTCLTNLAWKRQVLKHQNIERATDDLAQLLILICNVLNNITITFCKHDEILAFLQSISSQDRCIQFSSQNKWFPWISNGMLIFCCSIFLFEISYGMQMITVHKLFITGMLERFIQLCQLNAVLLIISMVINEITHRLENLNQMLLGMNDYFTRTSQNQVFSINDDGRPSEIFAEGTDNPSFCACEKLVTLRKCHIFLCNKVDECNQIFGVIMFFLIWVITITWLDASVMLISIQVIGNFQIDGMLDIKSNMGFLIFMGLFGIAGSMVQAVILACTAEKLSVETKKTSIICCTLQADFSSGRKFNNQTCYIRELGVLNRQSFQRQPCINAAGFFSVNHKILSRIMANVCSYLLIVSQFLIQKYRDNKTRTKHE
ncbi:uncharacterized protein LOC109543974 [Dendroctonus ponderosae]|uniref:Gustatory receptor n=1 Tax=Dendroctonus ponderosae TaxID=77166 RepID=A0AAR5Q8E0_DENPD|nr:uncharacterized protein LOC109543974 [Dendroctonus ponderosae]KAH1005158.1 hypothetical protein HUJ04_006194 [Dendroctonus ponderosae]KAH1012248.1 hypothetical protein HUJ05_011439 [Dendroctonus ponderosae]